MRRWGNKITEYRRLTSLLYIRFAGGKQWRIQGRGPGAASPLFLDQTEARRAEKMFFETAPPPPLLPYLSVWAEPGEISFLHDYDVKMPYFAFYGGRKQATTKFFLSFWAWLWFLEIQLQEGSPTFDKVSG